MHRMTLFTAISILFAALAFVSTGCEEKKAETEEKTAEAEQTAEGEAAEGEAAEGEAAPGAAAEGEAPAEAEAPAEGEATAEAGDKAKLVHQPGAQLGDRTICPVMGGEFEVTAESPSVEHEGKKVFFCCAGCDAKFQEDPAGKLAELKTKIDAANAE